MGQVQPALHGFCCEHTSVCAHLTADAVIHTAFIHTGNMSYDDRIAVDRAAIAALIDGLAGTK